MPALTIIKWLCHVTFPKKVSKPDTEKKTTYVCVLCGTRRKGNWIYFVCVREKRIEEFPYQFQFSFECEFVDTKFYVIRTADIDLFFTVDSLFFILFHFISCALQTLRFYYNSMWESMCARSTFNKFHAETQIFHAKECYSKTKKKSIKCMSCTLWYS